VRWVVAILLVVSLGLVGCGALNDAKKEAKKQVENVKREARDIAKKADALRKKVSAKVNETLAKIRNAVPRADEDTFVPTLRVSNSFEDFMSSVLQNVNRYWGRTFRAADLRRPRAKHRFIRPGQRVRTRCGEAANDQSAFYCPADDTIYFGESIGREIYDNIGDFGVAYALAHEYAHNVQQELGWFSSGQKLTTVAPFELQADCMAGTWAFAVYQRGKIDDSDVNEAVNTAFAVGDFDLTNPQHHGTPKERSRAWLLGYRSGDPSDCRGFVPA
jgi:predicted metalloprotease